MPSLPTFRDADSVHAEAENIELTMPSTLSVMLRARICVPGLGEMEDELRYADAMEALNNIRCQLRTRTVYSHSKMKNVKGQRLNIRAHAAQSSVNVHIRAATLRYCHELNDADVRGLGERALMNEERAEQERICELSGSSSNSFGVRHTGVVAVGEGCCMLSWL
ncbi:hypothetical protein SCP_0300510 [Sparassis crispa]|uniref:Uncharacterized protein n=1 Tax=Sparassis crispa TaxID=139825 RepID=A0A401GDT3_9APHY|nr:hypothetical protein SCP_0300510 [Sparassis crispa]GBE80336.1 hypothetical protein SCP_0300510 [Sparassis crispa]